MEMELFQVDTTRRLIAWSDCRVRFKSEDSVYTKRISIRSRYNTCGRSFSGSMGQKDEKHYHLDGADHLVALERKIATTIRRRLQNAGLFTKESVVLFT
ncbi:hypothetical protein TNCV_3967191 [Trichonephila clavipes]|nr:hypothetical protein TNCV_3967191 [Trichonephila clavipes]